MSTTEATNVNPKLRSLVEAGTSPWLDLLGRDLIHSGELARLRDEDSLRGVTSNPSIFEKSILDSSDYDEQLSELLGSGDLLQAPAGLHLHKHRGAGGGMGAYKGRLPRRSLARSSPRASRRASLQAGRR